MAMRGNTMVCTYNNQIYRYSEREITKDGGKKIDCCGVEVSYGGGSVEFDWRGIMGAG